MDAPTFRARRAALRAALPDGLILFPAAAPQPRNYADDTYAYRQSSHLLYYAGVDQPGTALALLPDGTATLFGPVVTMDDVVWSGPQPSLQERGAAAGVDRARPIEELGGVLAEAGAVHYLPPFQPGVTLQLARWLGRTPEAVEAGASRPLMRAVGEQRNVKDAAEVEEIEAALAVTAAYLDAVTRTARPGLTEAAVLAEMRRVATAHDRAFAFSPIVSVRGEVLHNHAHTNTLEDGQLLLVDSGAESPRGYASDITRTYPVSGRFSERQRAVYEIVLGAQQAAIEAIRPGASFREIHLLAAREIADGLIGLGLMRGDAAAAVEAGAHALFFPHGLGHVMGLDTHDMEDLGDVHTYPEGEGRSAQFGLGFLRLARDLQTGWVVTIEPGCYFIPALIDQWEQEDRHTAFVAYDALRDWRDFGGIRIEDDVLVTDDGYRILGPGIPKTVADVEAAMAR